MLRALKEWFGGKRSSPTGSKRAARRERRARPALECLEARELLTGTFPGFSLDNSGNLYNTTGTQPQLIDTGVRDFAVMSNTVYDLCTNGVVEALNPDGSGKADWDEGVLQMGVTGEGQLFTLKPGGKLYCFTPGQGNSL